MYHLTLCNLSCPTDIVDIFLYQKHSFNYCALLFFLLVYMFTLYVLHIFTKPFLSGQLILALLNYEKPHEISLNPVCIK